MPTIGTTEMPVVNFELVDPGALLLDCPAACKPGWKYYNSKCYRKFNTVATYAQAKSNCIAKGGKLVEIGSFDENEALRKEFDSNVVVGAPKQSWIGLRADGTDWKWNNENPATFSNWAPTEPAGSEKCVQMITDTMKAEKYKFERGGWKTFGCGKTTSSHICEMPAGLRLDLPWIIILIQFIVIIAMLISIFAYLITKPTSEMAMPEDSSTKTYENFELQTHPQSSSIAFRRRFKSSTVQPQSIDIDFSEDIFEEDPKKIEPIRKQSSPVIVNSIESEHSSEYEHFESENLRTAVTSESAVCSEFGRSVLVRGGNAVEAAICTSFCLMATLPDRASLAGGMMMVVSNPNGSVISINARESAPMAVSIEQLRKKPKLSQTGAKAIGVPGAVNGLWRAFEKFQSGTIMWKHLMIPTIQLCAKGVDVNKELGSQLQKYVTLINSSETSRQMLMKPDSNTPLSESDRFQCNSLASTLSELSEYDNPLDGFYRGELARKLVNDIEDGYLSLSDMEDYECDVNEALCTTVDIGTRLCGPGPPSLFPLLVHDYLTTKNMVSLRKIEEIIKSNMRFAKNLADPVFHKPSKGFAESLMKKLKLGDEADFKEVKVDFAESGSTSIFVVDEHNMKVSMTLSIGSSFGNGQMSSMGFFWNNRLRYFDLANENQPNSLQPGKVPTAALFPIIVMRNRTVSLISSGNDITSLVHVLREFTHRNFDSSRIPPTLFIQNSVVTSLKSRSQNVKLAGY
ncbi:unnamed protein product [Caenorhabditis bovis]|uniref:C-type lectin domain-containing protein n=1 Tax=Caenorhabditis bovis TaxID=2654633 RepID=A0A8S1E8C9_9PELO|nr:unnamed protein product [Caenorhabditis bovis]